MCAYERGWERVCVDEDGIGCGYVCDGACEPCVGGAYP